jgi:hypothetical protein
MTVTPASLRALYPEFTDPPYADATINAWLVFAVQFVDPGRWGNLADLGVTLWTCHNIALLPLNTKDTAFGKTPGQRVGVLTSKSIDGVSVSYDVSKTLEDNAGFFNLTTYGMQFIRFARMMGAGPVQIGTDQDLPSTGGSVSMAWPGPYVNF